LGHRTSVSLEWRYRGSADHDPTYEHIRTKPLFGESYEIYRGELGRDGSPQAVTFSWNAAVDTSMDQQIGGC